MIRLNRVTCGIVAGTVGVLAGIVAEALESRIFGVAYAREFWIVFFAAGGAVFATADWLGILSAPYDEPPMNLTGARDERETPPRA